MYGFLDLYRKFGYLNNDNWPDIISQTNFKEQDIYISINHDGTFTESLEKYIAAYFPYFHMRESDRGGYAIWCGYTEIYDLRTCFLEQTPPKMVSGPDNYA